MPKTSAIEELPSNDADDGRISKDHKLNYIDTLRGIAILMVIFVHHEQQFPQAPKLLHLVASYCQMGVQLFFVASAFTLCTSYTLRSAELNPLSSFFIRRYFRIAPLYYIGLVFYALCDQLFRYFGTPVGESLYTPLNVVANLLFVHGFVPTAYNGVVPGGWSIGTEMTFYLMFPLLFGLLGRNYSRAGMWPLYCLIAGSLAVNVLFQWFLFHAYGKVPQNNDIIYCSIINQLPVFLIGMTVFFARHGRGEAGRMTGRLDQSSHGRRHMLINAIGFLTFTLLAMACLRSNRIFGDEHGIATIFLPTVSAVSFVFLFNICRTYVSGAGLLEKIGQVSFSMYIFHFAFAWWLTKSLLDVTSSLIPASVMYVATLAITLTCTFAVAMLSKVVIEDRFIEFGRRWIRRRDGARATI